MPHKTAVVTGGLRGIGRSIVDTLRARGDDVWVFDYLPPTDAAVCSMLADVSSGVSAVSFGRIFYVQVDVSSPASIKEGFAQLFNHIKILDILVNNAGITRDTLALRMTEDDWDKVLDVNLKGAFFCSQEALKRMIRQPVSYIVTMSSVVGLRGNAGQVNYAASKAGIMAMTKTLAQEYGSRNVLVNALAPGFIQTPMTDQLPDAVKQKALEHIPLRRFGSPRDVAHCIAFLTSGQADYITGQIIEVTGGM